MTARSEHDAHTALSSDDWRRMRAGFTLQGPHRQQRRIGRWLLAFAAMAALIAFKAMA